MQPHIKGNLKFHIHTLKNDTFINILLKVKTTDDKNFLMSQFTITYFCIYLQNIASFFFVHPVISNNLECVGCRYLKLFETVISYLSYFVSFQFVLKYLFLFRLKGLKQYKITTNWVL